MESLFIFKTIWDLLTYTHLFFDWSMLANPYIYMGRDQVTPGFIISTIYFFFNLMVKGELLIRTIRLKENQW